MKGTKNIKEWRIVMIFITGLTGTSGSAFYDVLCRNRYSVPIRVLVRKTTDLSIFENAADYGITLDIAVGDINDQQFLTEAMHGCDTVFHIASKGESDAIVSAAAALPEIKRIILVSSTIVYSNYYKNCYLKEKESNYTALFDKSNKKYVFIRPTMIFGTPTDRNISTFVRWLMKYPVFPIVKNGSADIQPVHRRDLAEAYWLILLNFDRLRKTEYIVSGKDKMTIREMLRIIANLSRRKTMLINIPFPLAKAAVMAVYKLSRGKINYIEKLDRLTENRAYSHKDISDELGYSPRPFEEGLKELVWRIKEGE